MAGPPGGVDLPEQQEEPGSTHTQSAKMDTRSTTYLTLEQLLRHLNPMVRGWPTYFRYDAAKRIFADVDYFVWWRVMRWLRKKHPKRTWRYLRKRYCGGKGTYRWDGSNCSDPIW